MKKQPNTQKFNYPARIVFECPCCAHQWRDEEKLYCPNCEVRILYPTPLPGKDSVMYREVKEYPIALITPNNHMYNQWINDFGINGQDYVMVNSVDCIRGRYFSAIQPGLRSWEVDPGIVDFARDRVRPLTPPETQPVSVSEVPDDIRKYIGEAIYDDNGQMIFRSPDNSKHQLLDVRGWGTIQYMFETLKEAEEFQDKVGQWIADVINKELSTTQPTKVDEDEIEEMATQFASGTQFLSDFPHHVPSEKHGYLAGWKSGQSHRQTK